MEIHSMQGWAAITRRGVTRKRSTKRLMHTGSLFTKHLQSVGSCNYLHIKNLDVVFFSNAKNSSAKFAHEDNGWGIYYWWKSNWNRLYKVLHSSKKGKYFPSSMLCCGVSNVRFEQVNTGNISRTVNPLRRGAH